MDISTRITHKLNAQFTPQHLQVIDESAMHRHRQGQSHFKVIIVSTEFAKLTRIARHRLLQETLKEEYQRVHAISLHPYTPDEWADKQQTAPSSPACRGGEKK